MRRRLASHLGSAVLGVLGVERGCRGCVVRPESAVLRALRALRGGNGRRPAWLVLVALAAALSAGCEDVRHDFFPLAAGNSWVYRVRSEGRDLGTESIRVTERLSSDYTVSGAGAEADATEPRPSRRRRGTRAEFFRVLEPGGRSVWGADRGTVVRSSGAARSVVLLHPPFVGSGWTDDGPAAPGKRSRQVVYCKVIAREAAQTPAGWFYDCVVVRREAEDRSSIVTQWFAPDVGLVKWRVEQPERSAVEWALERYTLKPE